MLKSVLSKSPPASRHNNSTKTVSFVGVQHVTISTSEDETNNTEHSNNAAEDKLPNADSPAQVSPPTENPNQSVDPSASPELRAGHEKLLTRTAWFQRRQNRFSAPIGRYSGLSFKHGEEKEEQEKEEPEKEESQEDEEETEDWEKEEAEDAEDSSSPSIPEYFSIGDNWEQIVNLLASFLPHRPSREEIERRFSKNSQKQNSDSSSEGSSESDEDETKLTTEDQLARERERTKKANETIYNLLHQVNQYKQVLEDEKMLLQGELKEERENKLFMLSKQSKLEKKLQKVSEAFQGATQEYETKMQELEEDKQKRSKDHISNLQTLLKELSIIEEKNEMLNKQLEEQNQSSHRQTEEIETCKALIHQLTDKTKLLEQENEKLTKMKSSIQDLKHNLKRQSSSTALLQLPQSVGNFSPGLLASIALLIASS